MNREIKQRFKEKSRIFPHQKHWPKKKDNRAYLLRTNKRGAMFSKEESALLKKMDRAYTEFRQTGNKKALKEIKKCERLLRAWKRESKRLRIKTVEEQQKIQKPKRNAKENEIYHLQKKINYLKTKIPNCPNINMRKKMFDEMIALEHMCREWKKVH